MAEKRLRAEGVAPDVQPDSGVSALAVPVAAVARQFAKRSRHLSHGGFELLKADYVRPFAFDPFDDLAAARANAVDVPGGDFQHGRIIGKRRSKVKTALKKTGACS